MMFLLCGLEVFEDPINIFITNLFLSPDSKELETLVLGTHIVLNKFLFANVFDTKFLGVVPFMNYTWMENIEVSFDEANKAVLDPDSTSPSFCPLSLSFCNGILAHIIATTLIPQKGYLMVEVSTTYDSKAFASMGYVLIEKEWCKTESVKGRPDTSRISKPVPNSMSCVDKETEELKRRITTKRC
ncbi:hypothetical protein FXO38_31258 [Capsicum annuum]|nr:hypothetical protein FXO38_31258 [Capsicum annuum]